MIPVVGCASQQVGGARRRLIEATLAAMLAWSAALGATPPPQACEGRWVVAGAPLLGGPIAQDHDIVALAKAGVGIASGCSPARARLSRRGRKTVVRARWSSCGNLRRVRFAARIGAGCTSMRGSLIVKGRKKRQFSATPSRCGDGITDPGRSEACDGTDAGACPPGSTCTATCACLPLASTTTTVTTTTIPLPACGGPTGTITEVPSVDALLSALAQGSPGNTVRLAPGTYRPPGRRWSGHDFSDYDASIVIWDGLTLAGSGPDRTTIVLSAVPTGAGTQIFPREGSTLRDVRIVVAHDVGLLVSGVHRFSLCNVVVEYGSATSFGLQHNAWDDQDHVLEVVGSTFDCSACNRVAHSPYAFGIYPYTAGEPAVSVVISGSVVRDFTNGVEYCTYSGCGQVMVDADCAQFAGNTHAIWECGDMSCVDRCAP